MSNKKKNYRAMYNNQSAPSVDEIIETAVEELAETAVEESPAKIVFGCVTNCFKLNVRKNPSREADVVCIIEAGSDVEIDESGSTEDFYKIYTATGQEGYCMRRFIDINQ